MRPFAPPPFLLVCDPMIRSKRALQIALSNGEVIERRPLDAGGFGLFVGLERVSLQALDDDLRPTRQDLSDYPTEWRTA